jgi:tetratricopeptide (TPR) repeat protein
MNKSDDAGKYYDSALVTLNLELASDKNNALIHGSIGRVYAGKGDQDKAIMEGKKAIDLAISDKNKMDESEMILNLAQIYTLLGLFDDAIPQIEYSLNNPSLFSTKMLQIDPVWKPLRDRREFKTIITKYDNR